METEDKKADDEDLRGIKKGEPKSNEGMKQTKKQKHPIVHDAKAPKLPIPFGLYSTKLAGVTNI
jgi:hypothetical protein